MLLVTRLLTIIAHLRQELLQVSIRLQYFAGDHYWQNLIKTSKRILVALWPTINQAVDDKVILYVIIFAEQDTIEETKIRGKATALLRTKILDMLKRFSFKKQCARYTLWLQASPVYWQRLDCMKPGSPVIERLLGIKLGAYFCKAIIER